MARPKHIERSVRFQAGYQSLISRRVTLLECPEDKIWKVIAWDRLNVFLRLKQESATGAIGVVVRLISRGRIVREQVIGTNGFSTGFGVVEPYTTSSGGTTEQNLIDRDANGIRFNTNAGFFGTNQVSLTNSDPVLVAPDRSPEDVPIDLILHENEALEIEFEIVMLRNGSQLSDYIDVAVDWEVKVYEEDFSSGITYTRLRDFQILDVGGVTTESAGATILPAGSGLVKPEHVRRLAAYLFLGMSSTVGNFQARVKRGANTIMESRLDYPGSTTSGFVVDNAGLRALNLLNVEQGSLEMRFKDTERSEAIPKIHGSGGQVAFDSYNLSNPTLIEFLNMISGPVEAVSLPMPLRQDASDALAMFIQSSQAQSNVDVLLVRDMFVASE